MKSLTGWSQRLATSIIVPLKAGNSFNSRAGRAGRWGEGERPDGELLHSNLVGDELFQYRKFWRALHLHEIAHEALIRMSPT